MGINIGICETDAQNASCRELKASVVRVLVDDIKGFENVVEYDDVVSLDDAKSIVKDWEAFMKRNRVNADTDAIYMDKIKADSDLLLLKDKVKKVCTGWVEMSKLSEEQKEKALKASKKENQLTGWDLVDFDEMNEICAKCSLSWDKGRGCIGAFGPDNSLLPGIAEKYKCDIVASAPELAAAKKKLTPEDGVKLLKEIDILTAALPEEGKMMVRRYSGPLERMEAVAKISVKEKCGFYFF